MRRIAFKYVTSFILIFVMYSCGVLSISIKCQVSCFAIMLARQLRFCTLRGCRCHCNVSQKERTNSPTVSIDISLYIPGLFELSLFLFIFAARCLSCCHNVVYIAGNDTRHVYEGVLLSIEFLLHLLTKNDSFITVLYSTRQTEVAVDAFKRLNS